VRERTPAWLHGYRKLRTVTEKEYGTMYASLNLAGAMIL
jgi:hypothetical protein